MLQEMEIVTKKSGSSNFFVASIYFIVKLKIIKLVEAVKFLSSYRRNCVIQEVVNGELENFLKC